MPVCSVEKVKQSNNLAGPNTSVGTCQLYLELYDDLAIRSRIHQLRLLYLRLAYPGFKQSSYEDSDDAQSTSSTKLASSSSITPPRLWRLVALHCQKTKLQLGTGAPVRLTQEPALLKASMPSLCRDCTDTAYLKNGIDLQGHLSFINALQGRTRRTSQESRARTACVPGGRPKAHVFKVAFESQNAGSFLTVSSWMDVKHRQSKAKKRSGSTRLSIENRHRNGAFTDRSALSRPLSFTMASPRKSASRRAVVVAHDFFSPYSARDLLMVFASEMYSKSSSSATSMP
eukprot:SM000001S04586  [mRNA]  locus=s1:1083092:1088154:- [translate_table: standard]